MYGPGRYTGWVPGRVIRVGNTGYPATLKAEGMYSEAGPGRPIGPGVGGTCLQRPLPPHATARGGPLPAVGMLLSSPGKPASWPIRARLHLIYTKLSQNGIVSPKCVEKASHSPCFQNRVPKSPLDFLGFPFRPAFSHKELMVHFRPRLDFIVKMTKCRPCVHVREGVGARCQGLRCA